MKKLLLIAALLIPGLSRADQIVANQYYGLNNNASPPVIDSTEAQDLLNTDVSITGNSFKKRRGYGLYKNLGVSAGVRGGRHFFDSSGNDVQVWGSSVSLYGIVGGGTPTQLVSSATVRATWDCADTQGFAYCVNSSRDAYIRTNGATMSWYTTPLGTMVEATPDRVIVAGVSATPNTIYVSQSNIFTNYVVGVNAGDPFIEPIAAPGSRLTHLRWGCGKVLWWKDQSFGSFDFDDQYNVSIKTISDTIGTFDNTSAIDPGGNVWFRGQEGHTYRYDCSFLTKETIPITPNVQASGIRTSNAWTQTTQADWQAGSIVPTASLSTALSPGDVIVSSFSGFDATSTAQWSAGTASNYVVGTSSLSMATNFSGNITNPGFESGDGVNWYSTGTGMTAVNSVTVTGTCGNISAQSGSWYAVNVIPLAGFVPVFEMIDISSNVLASKTMTLVNDCTWRQLTMTSSGQIGKRVRFRVHTLTGTNYFSTVESYILGYPDVTFYFASAVNGSDASKTDIALDVVSAGSSTIATGNFTSRVFDTGLTKSNAQIQAAWLANGTTPYFELQHSASSSGPFTKIVVSTGTSAFSSRYLRYVSSMTVGSAESALTAITNVTIVSHSSGTFYSQVHNAPNINGWDTLGVTKQDDGGSHAFSVRASTDSFTILSSTPTWTSVTPGSLITASTGTYMQFKDDFSVSAATQSPSLSEGILSWFEGSATDQSYFEYFDNAIWESVAYGGGQSANNYIFKCDLLRYASDPSKSCWTLYNFGTGGFLVQANTLYFGNPSSGDVYNYGTAASDNGTAINAYRKSKEFSGSDPFLQNQLQQIDTYAKKDNGTTLTTTYTTDGLTSTSYSVSLSTGGIVAQSRKLLPSGKLGYTFNIQYGDTSTSSNWEIFGFRITAAQLPYRVTQ